jgi:hypothetical protein
MLPQWAQDAYVKASNTAANNWFGSALALSDDGETLAVGAWYESSSATGINGAQTNSGAFESGAVYVYTRGASGFLQTAYIKASNTGGSDHFGFGVSLSADGDTLAVGATEESSDANTINGDQTSNASWRSGAVYVFTRSAGVWSQQAYIKASNNSPGDFFGFSVHLSDTGDTLAVGAPYEASNAVGLGGDPTDNSAPYAGAAYVYVRSNGVWSEQAYIKGTNTEAADQFGYPVRLSGDGSTLVVGAEYEDGNGLSQSSNGQASSGAAYVFTRTAALWSQQAYLKASPVGAGDSFGMEVAISSDGHTVAVGAPFESSGVANDPTDNSLGSAGAAYAFTLNGTQWIQSAYLKAAPPTDSAIFGMAIGLSRDGTLLAVGAYGDASNASGINGNPNNSSTMAAGAVHTYSLSGTTWSHEAYLKASNPDLNDSFGFRLGLSANGRALAVGAQAEASHATGINGDQLDNSLYQAGAAYVFIR